MLRTCLRRSIRNGGARWMSRKQTPDSVSTFLEETLGIESSLHPGILKALQTVYGRDIELSHLEGFGPEGLKALAESVKREQPARKPRTTPSRTLRFQVPHHRSEFDLKWQLGDSLLDVAKSLEGSELLGEYMEGTCGGQMSCCTCHVYLEPATLAMIPPPLTSELDMLDLAYDPRDESRLGCQVVLTPQLIEQVDADTPIRVTIPEGVNDVWN